VGKWCANASTSSPLSITRVSGCKDIGNTTLDCTYPLQLSVAVEGLNEDISGAQVFVGEHLCSILDISIRRDLIRCELTVVSDDSNCFPTPSVLSVTISDSLHQSEPFPSVWMMAQPCVHLMSLSGCEGSGLITSNCNPIDGLLTITGSGFEWISTEPNQVQLLVNNTWTMTSMSQLLVSRSESVLTMNLTELFMHSLIDEPRSVGTTWSLAFRIAGFQSNELYLSWGVIPAPVVIGVKSPDDHFLGCNGIERISISHITQTGCSSGSMIIIEGRYLGVSPFEVRVGDVLCTQVKLQNYNVNNVLCSLPELHAGLVDTPLNLSVRTAGGESIFEQALTYWTTQILSIDGCSNGQPFSFGSKCMAGDHIIVHGRGFLPDSSVVVAAHDRLTIMPSLNNTLACERTIFVNSTQLICVVPSMVHDHFQLDMVFLQIYLAGQARSNALWSMVFDAHTSPRVSQVDGLTCSLVAESVVMMYPQSSVINLCPHHSNNSVGTASLVLRGQGFSGRLTLQIGSQVGRASLCTSILVKSAQELECELTTLGTEGIAFDMAYPVALERVALDTPLHNPTYSNTIYLRFPTPLTDSQVSSSASGSS
jgi:hypothetical protein